jgi:hypothetical protein
MLCLRLFNDIYINVLQQLLHYTERYTNQCADIATAPLVNCCLDGHDETLTSVHAGFISETTSRR